MGNPQRKARPLLYDPRDERALRRLKAEGGPWDWNVMNWFVQLAKRDLDQMSEGDLLNLQEEQVAIRRTFSRDLSARPLAKAELFELRDSISKYLSDLITAQRVVLGPFPMSVEINLPKARDQRDQQDDGWIPKFIDGKGPSQLPSKSVRHHVKSELSLLYEFARGLEKHADSIKRCPHCANIFLQFRSSAIYCSRECQQVAVMRKIRTSKVPAGAKRVRWKASQSIRQGGERGQTRG